MRTLCLPVFLLALLWSQPGAAQVMVDSSARAQAAPTRITAFATERNRLDQRGLAVLGGWALSNLAVSGVAATQTDGSARYFHQMNVGWGAINLALAGAGYLGARRPAPTADRAATVRSQFRTEKIYLFNAGLDLAYLATGVYLLEKGRNPTGAGPAERWRGYGQSLLLQGGFLLLFDGAQFVIHHRHGNRDLYPLLSGVSFGPTSVAVTFPLGQPGRAATQAQRAK